MSKAGNWTLPYEGHAEHGGLWFGFSSGGHLCAWDDLHVAAVTTDAGPKATAVCRHQREERRPPRRPSTSPLSSSFSWIDKR
ncbi:hypothetical protein ACQJBY_057834 [Aegilops geniculata]